MPNHHNKANDMPSNEGINKRLLQDSNKIKDTVKYKSTGVKDQPHRSVTNPTNNDSILTGSSFTKDFTDIMESLNEVWRIYQEMDMEVAPIPPDMIETDIEVGVTDTPDNMSMAPSSVNNDELIDKLNKIFTPILIMQDAEDDMSSEIKESLNTIGVLTERSTIHFDNKSRMDQLVSICAILLQQAKNTPEYQMYVKGHKLRKKAKLRMQELESQNAKDLAQKYLVNVSTSNPSEAARKAATNLLPETQI